MIVSASYKTDIPAFYGQWLMNRLRAGYCRMTNPYSGQVYHVPLDRGSVDGLVFWTRNLTAFLPRLAEVRRMGYPFIIQYGINGYPRALEPGVIDAGRSALLLRRAADEFGPRVCVWRYDTILFTSLTDADFHRANFERLARRLEGAADEVVVSFAQVYRKTLANVNRAAAEHGFAWRDPPDAEKHALLADLVAIAAARGMKLTVCSQRRYAIDGAGEARCIDAGRLGEVAGRSISARLRGNRPECGCHECRDIGQYNTCPQGCVYCYAVTSPSAARRRLARHDPEGEFLLAPSGPCRSA